MPDVREELGTLPVTGADDDLHDVLQDERHADRRDQRGDARRVPQRPVGEPLDRDVHEAHDGHRDAERARSGRRRG